MFEILLWVTAGIVLLGTLIALDGSRDVFHPLIFIGPMMGFLYVWMPARLLASDGLSRYFDADQLVFLQTLYIGGIVAFLGACLAAGLRVHRLRGPQGPLDLRSVARPAARPSALRLRISRHSAGPRPREVRQFTPEMYRRLLVGAGIAGSIGLGCWMVTIHNVGGFVNAFSASYAGGWDDSGYVRDGSLLMLVGVLLSVTSLSLGGPRVISLAMTTVFGLPWAAQALLTARRGPTFAITVILLMGWYMARRKRPPALAMAGAGFVLGWVVLFLVTNRQSIHLGADLSDVSTDVTTIADKPDTGNEYIYGGGSVISAQRRDHYFWMRRYLAQVMVRPIPSAIWPTKYEDFGVPELLQNGGTDAGISDAMGWQGAVGSAPGIVSDLWIEMSWLAIPGMAALGWLYGFVWKRSVERGGPWTAQYVILAALSIYLVMQTMEAVIFRSLLLSLPCWLSWRWALRAPRAAGASGRPAGFSNPHALMPGEVQNA